MTVAEGVCQTFMCGPANKKTPDFLRRLFSQPQAKRLPQALLRAIILLRAGAGAAIALAVAFALTLGRGLFLLGLPGALRERSRSRDGHHHNKRKDYPHCILLLPEPHGVQLNTSFEKIRLPFMIWFCKENLEKTSKAEYPITNKE